MVKTLVDLCTNVCIKNVKDISDVGSAPYSILRSILLKIDNPAQLREVEERSPHIQGDDAECWQRLINRDFPHQVKKHNFEPRNPTLWHKVYDKYKKIEVEEKRAALEKLTSSLKTIKKEKQEKASKVINYDARILGPAPGRRKGVGGREVAGAGGLRWGGGSRTKTTSAQSIMQKARREAAEISRRNKLMTPTGQLPVRRGQIVQAPLGMREEHRIKTLPTMPTPRRIQAPQPRTGERWEREQKEREARLLKLKNGTTTKKTTIISDDEFDEDDQFDDDDDEVREGGSLNVEELEDLFDDDTPSTSNAPKPIKTAAVSQNKPSSSHSSVTNLSLTRASGSSGLAGMKMGHSWKNNPMRIVPIESPTQKTASKSSASSPPAAKYTAASPPLRPSMPSKASSSHPPAEGSTYTGTSNSSADPKPKPKPMLGQKRKEPPSVFMKPKSKGRRMS
ncbi:RNA polymerase II transcription factor SIII subunit A-domain-containing protein [Daldinia loculata]|uniref:RNA polymerase II transcription factor SIII subunit A-domain-containing protein n=1 Tax=Daldinia loculata TaxID=103429 RepID=UPI0020C5114C|nr:RNA polymerase II transcription factor SIII subunit A-domain-containing protein [Daldinia loculata]KAI1642425.1 RNA polymerase II transcription factor SIII subunit A-domain-containing protein [Daldinia loculata]